MGKVSLRKGNDGHGAVWAAINPAKCGLARRIYGLFHKAGLLHHGAVATIQGEAARSKKKAA